MRSDEELKQLAALRLDHKLAFAGQDVSLDSFLVFALMPKEQLDILNAKVESGEIASIFEHLDKMTDRGKFFSCEFLSEAEMNKFNEYLAEMLKKSEDETVKR